MRYSVCIIDNDLPASGQEAQALGINDSGLLNASNLQLLIQREKWTDQVIRNLTATLLEAREQDGVTPKWDVYGFTHPSFYINAIDNGFFRSDLVIFDWDYPGGQNATVTNSESILKQILDRTFCLIFIFSSADKKDEIEAILAKPEFQEYKERLQYLDKAVDNVDQTNALLQKADEMYANNFSFQFASVLRRRSVQCADQILSDMGRASLNDVKNLLVVGEGGKKDFIDFLAERFRTSIAGPNIYDLVKQIPTSAAAPAIDPALASKVWSYRLYFQQETGDELVRRGDIVAVGDEVLLVLSADCDLLRFWHKNLGIINAVALHALDQSNATLKDMLALCVKPELAKSSFGSLLGKMGNLPEGPFVLPFVPADTGGLKNFLAIPKDLVSRRIPTPAGWSGLGKDARKDHPMRYEYWTGARRLCTVSEPFLTPVIQHVFNTIGGAGVPDYPEHMKEVLKKILEDFSTVPAAATATITAAAQPAPAAGEPPIPVAAPPEPAAVAFTELQGPTVPAGAENPPLASAHDPSPAAGTPAPNPTEEPV
jgi:hypothetical protein